MTVALTGTGGYFTRIGLLRTGINGPNKFLAAGDTSAGGLVTVGVAANNIEAQFQSALQGVIDNLYTQRDAVRGSMASWKSYLQGLAVQTLLQMVNADVPMKNKTSITEALAILQSQMVTSADTILGPTISAAVTSASGNTGTGIGTASMTDYDGKPLDYAFAETITATCTNDSQRGATSGKEPFAFLGQAAQADELYWDWEKGSGAAGQLSAVDGSSYQGVNLLNNSSFDTWTVANTPDGFSILTGVAGADVLRSSTPYDGTYSLEYLGDGATLTSLAQTFNQTTGGTTGKLLPLTVYAFNSWVRIGASAPAAGVLKVDLVDGSNTVINNAFGTANTLTKDLTVATTGFVPFSGYFQTPASIGTVKLRIRLSTAITSAKFMLIDRVSLTPAFQFYKGGPWGAIFSGATPFVFNDVLSFVISQNYGSKFARGLERLYGLRNLGGAYKFPSLTSANTINENLVTQS